MRRPAALLLAVAALSAAAVGVLVGATSGPLRGGPPPAAEEGTRGPGGAARSAPARGEAVGWLAKDATTPEDVRRVVRFADRATRADVPALRAAALGAHDPLVAGNSVRALGRLRAVAGDEKLVALVGDPRPRVRDETILALGESGDARAVAPLEPLTRHADPKVRRLVLRALARLAVGGADGVARSGAREITPRPPGGPAGRVVPRRSRPDPAGR